MDRVAEARVVVAERAVAERAAETAVAVSAAGGEQGVVEQVLAMAATVADLAELVLDQYSPLLTTTHLAAPSLATRHTPLATTTTHHHSPPLTTTTHSPLRTSPNSFSITAIFLPWSALRM